MTTSSRFSDLCKPGTRIHMIGIGGVGMAALARILKAKGCIVSGSDLESNTFTQQLQQEGLHVHLGHSDAALHPLTDYCIYSTAIRDDHIERTACRLRGIPQIQRGIAFARLARGEGSIAVTGTHGKTSTTAMITHLLMSMGTACDCFVGAEGLNGEFITEFKDAPFFVFEADESDGTLMQYHPQNAVITNIDYDHMEHHANEGDFLEMFARFVSQVTGTVVINSSCRKSADLVKGRHPVMSFGLNAPSATIHATAIQLSPEGSTFDVHVNGEHLGSCQWRVPGEHMIENAVAALTLLHGLGKDVAQAVAHVSSFQPVKRRMELLSHAHDIRIYTDYAHHPTELAAALRVITAVPANRRIIIFQPHRYTRTQALMDDFVTVLQGPFDLYLAPVYPASEAPMDGGTTADLAERLEAAGQAVQYAENMYEMMEERVTSAKAGDVIAVLGAGDIDSVIRRVIDEGAWV